LGARQKAVEVDVRTFAKDLMLHAAVSAGRWLHRKKATVIFYHRFGPQSAARFRRQCDYLLKHHRVISMRDLTRLLRSGAAPPPNAVVITLDDGHRDFYACAFPILREYGLAATMYLPTAFLDCTEGYEWLWFDRFTYAFRHSPPGQVELPALASGEPHTSVRLDSAVARAAACAAVLAAAQWLSRLDRDAYCSRVADALRIRIPDAPPDEFAPLSWDEVRTMARSGIEFGGHTVTHPILQTIGTPEELGFEIAHSKLRIEEELQEPVAHFAYPSGKADEIPAAAKEAVRRAGFETAVTTLSGQVGPGDDPLWLQRIGVGPELAPWWFERCAADVWI
jgi:peptidoglycan/xylan/chitin deacetylase (PgdA/CDA1 family)